MPTDRQFIALHVGITVGLLMIALAACSPQLGVSDTDLDAFANPLEPTDCELPDNAVWRLVLSPADQPNTPLPNVVFASDGPASVELSLWVEPAPGNVLADVFVLIHTIGLRPRTTPDANAAPAFALEVPDAPFALSGSSDRLTLRLSHLLPDRVPDRAELFILGDVFRNSACASLGAPGRLLRPPIPIYADGSEPCLEVWVDDHALMVDTIDLTQTFVGQPVTRRVTLRNCGMDTLTLQRPINTVTDITSGDTPHTTGNEVMAVCLPGQRSPNQKDCTCPADASGTIELPATNDLADRTRLVEVCFAPDAPSVLDDATTVRFEGTWTLLSDDVDAPRQTITLRGEGINRQDPVVRIAQVGDECPGPNDMRETSSLLCDEVWVTRPIRADAPRRLQDCSSVQPGTEKTSIRWLPGSHPPSIFGCAMPDCGRSEQHVAESLPGHYDFELEITDSFQQVNRQRCDLQVVPEDPAFAMLRQPALEPSAQLLVTRDEAGTDILVQADRQLNAGTYLDTLGFNPALLPPQHQLIVRFDDAVPAGLCVDVEVTLFTRPLDAPDEDTEEITLTRTLASPDVWVIGEWIGSRRTFNLIDDVRPTDSSSICP